MRMARGVDRRRGVGKKGANVSGLCMAKRPNSPAVCGSSGIGLSPRDGARRHGMCG